MTMNNDMDLKTIIKAPEYEFLKTNPHLGKNIILIGLAGSYSYGTNNENSDFDIRGATLNQREELLNPLHPMFEQYVEDKNTDTCIYGLHKLVSLLLDCNPNTIELLGLKPEHYLYLHPIGQELLNHKKMFLSKKAVQSFGGYAGAQLRRLENALARDNYPQKDKEKHILNSLNNAMYDFAGRYNSFSEGAIKLYIDESRRDDFDTEIYMDVALQHYPLRDYRSIWNELNNIIKDYDKIGKRNRKKDDNHLNKHAMHLIRLFLMAIDILEKEDIITFREKEHDMLMDIREGKYQKEDGTFRSEFYELLSYYENRLIKSANETSLAQLPDNKAIDEFIASVNERVIHYAV